VENISGAQQLEEMKVPLLVQWANRFLKLGFVKSMLPSVERVEEHGRRLQATGWKVNSVRGLLLSPWHERLLANHGARRTNTLWDQPIYLRDRLDEENLRKQFPRRMVEQKRRNLVEIQDDIQSP
jgi:hypothetical protein